MMHQILDLHIHSKYSRACSKDLELPKIAKACETKGIDIVATGDYTHPAWLEHIKESLVEENEGIYVVKSQIPMTKSSRSERDPDSPSGQINPNDQNSKTRFILSTELSCIYSHGGKVRRIHLIVLAPNIAAVEKLIKALEARKVNLRADGRPIMGLSAKEITKIALDIDNKFTIIPAHAWTPWFSVFGSKSGYDTLEECFEELTPHIRAIETGLSSDPPMNHRLSKLDNIVLVSNSDAHSLDKLGREANAFAFTDSADLSYEGIRQIIEGHDKEKFLYTIEFYPEEGKYHFDGHRECKVVLSPKETKKLKEICPVCGKKLTVGVLHRVDDLADREEKENEAREFIPHKYIVPLREVIGQVFEVGPKSKKVEKEYANLTKNIGSEFYILLEAEEEKIRQAASDENIARAIRNMRSEAVKVSPGYDGEFGKIDVLSGAGKTKPKQRELF